jgi:hypothetical protein
MPRRLYRFPQVLKEIDIVFTYLHLDRGRLGSIKAYSCLCPHTYLYYFIRSLLPLSSVNLFAAKGLFPAFRLKLCRNLICLCIVSTLLHLSATQASKYLHSGTWLSGTPKKYSGSPRSQQNPSKPLFFVWR